MLERLKNRLDPQRRRKLALLARRLLNPPPRGLKRAGAGMKVCRPFRLDGRRCIEVGDGATINGHARLSAIEAYAGRDYSPRIAIGRDVYIGGHAYITAISSVVIEDGCALSEHVYISDSAHGMEPDGGLIMEQPLVHRGDVHIRADTFIGYRACIMPGVTLGRHCVVGANSVVTRSFPDHSMVAGSPARLIKVFCPERGEWVAPGPVRKEHS